MIIPYVDEQSASTARSIEEKLSSLSKEAGIIFVGAVAVPTMGGKSYLFEIVLGIAKNISMDAIRALTLITLMDLGIGRSNSVIRIFNGIPGKFYPTDSSKGN